MPDPNGEKPSVRPSAPEEGRAVGFTDASYIPRDEAPNLPRVFSYDEPKEEREKRGRRLPGGTVVLLCLASLLLGAGLQSLAARPSPAESASDPAPPELQPTAAAVSASVSLPTATPVIFVSEAAADRASAGEEPCLGIVVQTVTGAVAEYYNQYYECCMVEGAQIYAVDDGSAAARAGLAPGDIITAVDGRAILSAGDLTAAEALYRAGDAAEVTVYRQKAYISFPVIFEARTAEEAPGW